MDEREWLASTDPAAMLEWVRGNHPLLPPCPAPPPSDRKLRLFACACRERAVESLAADWAAAYGSEGEKIRDCPGLARAWANRNASDGPDLTQPLKAALLREIIGNPFRCHPLCGDIEGYPVHHRDGLFGCRWCDAIRADPAVRGIARRAHDLRDWDALPVLADALEEAGCEDEEVLMHCRGQGRCPGCLGKGGCCSLKDGPGFYSKMHRCVLCVGTGRVDAGPHCRGCWATDLILGKG